MSEKAEKVESALGEEESNEDQFLRAMENDATFKRFGKFRIGSRNCWWAVARHQFGLEVPAEENGGVRLIRHTYLEYSVIHEGEHVVRRLVLGRLLLQLG